MTGTEERAPVLVVRRQMAVARERYERFTDQGAPAR